MKKIILFILSIFVFSVSLSAQEDTMYIHLKKGNISKVAVNDIDSIVFYSAVDSICENPDTVVIPPTNLSEKINKGSVLFTWRGSGNTYEIEVGGTVYEAEATSFILEDILSYNTNYSWKVRAKKGNKYSEWSESREFKIPVPEDPQILFPPTNLKIEQVGAFSALFSFEKSTVVDYEVNVNGISQVVKSNDDSVKVYFYTPVELLPNTNYSWKVRAIDDGKASEWVEHFFKTQNMPSQYIKVKFDKNGAKEVWEANINNIGGLININLSDDKEWGYVNALSIKQDLPNIENINTNRAVSFQFPTAIGIYGLYNGYDNDPYYSFVDYAEYSLFRRYGRIGDWISYNGEVQIKDSYDDVNDGRNIKYVKGAYTANLYNYRDVLSLERKNSEKAMIEVEFVIGVVEADNYPEDLRGIPLLPLNLKVIRPSNHEAILSWERSVCDTYEINIRDSYGKDTTFSIVDSFYYMIDTLSEFSYCYCKVRTKCGNNYSEWVDFKQVVFYPPVPSNSLLTVEISVEIEDTWVAQHISSGITRYLPIGANDSIDVFTVYAEKITGDSPRLNFFFPAITQVGNYEFNDILHFTLAYEDSWFAHNNGLKLNITHYDHENLVFSGEIDLEIINTASWQISNVKIKLGNIKLLDYRK